jgi:hypothetical protein
MSKIKHFDSHSVTFEFLNHRTKKYNKTTITIEEFFDRFIQHIPEKFFKMTRYYGLFATAVRGKTLPKLFKIFNQKPALTHDSGRACNIRCKIFSIPANLAQNRPRTVIFTLIYFDKLRNKY